MPAGPGDDRRISVGLFSERERADKRALSLRKLNLNPEVAPRTVPGTVLWMDVDLPQGSTTLAVRDLLPAEVGSGGGAGSVATGEGGSASVQAVACPGSNLPRAVPSGPVPDSATFRTKVATGTPKVP